MKVLDVISLILLGSVPSISALLKILTIAGLTRMFRKSGVDWWWALIPCARTYMLARCAGREPEGRTLSLMEFAMLVAGVFTQLTSAEWISIFFAVGVIMLDIAIIIYRIRVYKGLTEVYNRHWLWIFAWLLADFIAAPLWGFWDRFQPDWKVEEIRQQSVAVLGGHDLAPMSDGLTINLEERTATEFFQKKYLLRDIHMYIQPGHMVLLLGGSGAGKTTFLNAVNGYEQANAKVTLNGSDVYGEYKKMQYEVGFVPQQELMRPKDTVYRTLTDASLLRLPTDIPLPDRRARVDEVMQIFGLVPVKNNLVEKLSGGQKKRLSIAMEFISNPSLFILDEPDSGLDGAMARELMEQLRRIADQGKIVIVITHTPDRVIDLFDDVIVLAKDSNRTGRLAFFGPIEEARAFFGKERMEQIVMSINRKEEGGEGRADEYISKYLEVQHG